MNKELSDGTADEQRPKAKKQHVSPACIKPNVSSSLPIDFETVQSELNKRFDNIRMGAEHTLFLNEMFIVRRRQ